MISLIRVLIIVLNVSFIYGKPQQIHISLGGKPYTNHRFINNCVLTANPTEMMVTFTTFSKTDESVVRYNKMNGVVKTVNSQITKFHVKNYKAHVHRARLVDLEPGQEYEYQCGTDGHWSDILRFKTVSNRTDTAVRVAIYGDLGLENGISIGQLRTDVKKGLYDSIFHLGDIAYDLNSNNGKVGDDFMNKIEPIAAIVPYQVCPGNHEDKKNFTHYLNRFSMIDSKSNQINNHFYSFDIGPAHFIFFSTELYFWPEYFTESHRRWQYQWIQNDLEEATKSENRDKRPWIITLGHRPMYCLKDMDKDCFHRQSIIRSGRSGENLDKSTEYGLEDLFYKYGVDIQFYGHKHIYERTYPMYDFKANKTGQLYDNPKAPIHIVSGAAGTTDRPSLKSGVPDWVAFYSKDWGFTRMNVQNKTHIFIEQFSTENSKIVDSFVIRKD